MNCVSCGVETKNLKFCSRSCSATYNNIHREKKLKCKNCGNPRTCKSWFCSNKCRIESQQKRTANVSKIELESRTKTKDGAYAQIIKMSRRVYMDSGKPKICAICGYDKHVEICHIKPVRDFIDEPIKVINSIDNLIALCPNHHWEFDSGFLLLDH